MAKTLIDLAYTLAKESFGDKDFTFDTLYKLVSKNKTEMQSSQNIGEFYNDLLQDPRFTYIGQEKWKLNEFLSYNEHKNIDKMLYNIKISDNEKVEANLADTNVAKEIEAAEIENETIDGPQQNDSEDIDEE